MQAKREKYNNSALVSGNRDQREAFANLSMANQQNNQ